MPLQVKLKPENHNSYLQYIINLFTCQFTQMYYYSPSHRIKLFSVTGNLAGSECQLAISEKSTVRMIVTKLYSILLINVSIVLLFNTWEYLIMMHIYIPPFSYLPNVFNCTLSSCTIKIFIFEQLSFNCKRMTVTKSMDLSTSRDLTDLCKTMLGGLLALSLCLHCCKVSIDNSVLLVSFVA